MNDPSPEKNTEKADSEKGARIQPRDPLVGTVLDNRFQIESVIGTGGMSVVYKATQLRVNRHVAIKTLKLQLDTKEVYRERFQREISSLCTLNHPNIVTVFDCVIGTDDQPYIVMDYLRGRSLEALIADEGPMSIERFAGISIQICSALEHAHKRGIIHRDLKPGNIVLMDDEMDFVKVVDFGLAKIGDQNKRLTHSGELWGSPPYMSPEQCMGEPLDSRSDIYSFGAVMYEMLCGVDPFPNATTVFEFIKNHTTVLPPAMIAANPRCNVPPKVEAVVFKALEKDPNARYQSAKELQDAIVEASSAVVDRERGEFLRHLANQASSKTPSGQSSDAAPAVGGPDLYEPDALAGPSASEAFRRALNPFSRDVNQDENQRNASAYSETVEFASPRTSGEVLSAPSSSSSSSSSSSQTVDTLQTALPATDDKGAKPVNTLHGPNAAHPSKPFLVVLLLVAVACLIYVTFPSLTNFGRRTYTPALRPTAPPTSFKSSDAVKIDASSDSLERGQVGGAPGNSNGESANKNGGAKNHMGAAARHVHANANVHKPAPVKTNSSLSKQLPKGSSAKSSADPWATLDRMR